MSMKRRDVWSLTMLFVLVYVLIGFYLLEKNLYEGAAAWLGLAGLFGGVAIFILWADAE